MERQNYDFQRTILPGKQEPEVLILPSVKSILHKIIKLKNFLRSVIDGSRI